MSEMDALARRAQDAALLDDRIASNKGAQQLDLVPWILGHLGPVGGMRILELCCGTGNQSVPLAEGVGPSGRLLAVDISEKALDALGAKLAPEVRARVKTVAMDLDEIPSRLDAAAPGEGPFDLVFCAYGLYYSKDAPRVLDYARSRLAPGGRIVVVGPFGPNNGALFDLVRSCGVTFEEYVTYTSSEFMAREVVPWAACAFQRLVVRTAVNRVTWKSSGDVLKYWKSTTFYDAAREAQVVAALEEHFAQRGEFVNEKWIMMAEMADAR